MARSGFLPALAAAAILASASAPAAGPAKPLRFTLNLTHPMLADRNVRLEPGDYDVDFEASPAGMPHFTAVFSRGGARVATAPAELKGAPAGTNASDFLLEWTASSWDRRFARHDGSINPVKFEVRVKSERAFLEVSLTPVAMPGTNPPSKTPTPGAPKATPTKK